jgi:hypothetical protein
MRNRFLSKDQNEETRKRIIQAGMLTAFLLLLLLFLFFPHNRGLQNHSNPDRNRQGSSGDSDFTGDPNNDAPGASKIDPVARSARNPVPDTLPPSDRFKVQLLDVDANGINYAVTVESGNFQRTFSTSDSNMETALNDFSDKANDPAMNIFGTGKGSDPVPISLFENGDPILVASGGGDSPGPGPTQEQNGDSPFPLDGGTPGGGGNPGGTPWNDNFLFPPGIYGGGGTSSGGGTPSDMETLSTPPPSATPVPEPGTMTLLGTGLAGIAVRGWRKITRKRGRANPEN